MILNNIQIGLSNLTLWMKRLTLETTPRVTRSDFDVLITALRDDHRALEAFKWETLRDRLFP